ncbi:MAG: helix-turn-helix transcriptional regulator [Thermomicrobiales bacterium]
MYHPTTRVLAALELLQSRGRLSGAELAERLEVDERTVRRYITMLQDLGIPVEGERGRYGGYRLRHGFKLPPLMFSDDEALAVTLGLLVARRLGLVGAAPAVEGALAKVERVLPEALRHRLTAVQDSLIFDLPEPPTAPRGSTIGVLSEATQRRRQVRLSYGDVQGALTEREFDSYGLVHLSGRWYTAGYCHLRQAMRVFRLDRIAEVAPVEATFDRPAGFDPLAFVQAAVASAPGFWTVEVLLLATLEEARERVAPTVATLEAVDGGVLMRCRADQLEWLARLLIRIGLPLIVRRPDELRAELRLVAKEAIAWADVRERREPRESRELAEAGQRSA